MDAAVATAFAVGVAEPYMSGVGGSGAMTIWLQKEGRAEFLDFYAAQNADTWAAALESGRITEQSTGPADLRIVGIPGQVAGLLAAHEKYGRLTRAQVLAPAIRLAEEGFPVHQVMAEFILSSEEKIARFAPSQRILMPGGKALAPGDRYRSPELAAVLRRVAEQGAPGFYQGETARRIVEALNAAGNPATMADMAGYPVQWERPVCAEYRGRVLLSAPPPQSGAHVLQTLELLEPFDLPALGLPTHSARALDVLASALRVGIADNRGQWGPELGAHGRGREGVGGLRGGAVGAGGEGLRHQPRPSWERPAPRGRHAHAGLRLSEPLRTHAGDSRWRVHGEPRGGLGRRDHASLGGGRRGERGGVDADEQLRVGLGSQRAGLLPQRLGLPVHARDGEGALPVPVAHPLHHHRPHPGAARWTGGDGRRGARWGADPAHHHPEHRLRSGLRDGPAGSGADAAALLQSRVRRGPDGDRVHGRRPGGGEEDGLGADGALSRLRPHLHDRAAGREVDRGGRSAPQRRGARLLSAADARGTGRPAAAGHETAKPRPRTFPGAGLLPIRAPTATGMFGFVSRSYSPMGTHLSLPSRNVLFSGPVAAFQRRHVPEATPLQPERLAALGLRGWAMPPRAWWRSARTGNDTSGPG
ncbi:MAG: gamma-glutamyltransferase [Desulfobacterales bacterium]|nr:gamma-glutamyltransferase [Desulfobacterales bacterium]